MSFEPMTAVISLAPQSRTPAAVDSPGQSPLAGAFSLRAADLSTSTQLKSSVKTFAKNIKLKEKLN
jgi:hypothetical protein